MAVLLIFLSTLLLTILVKKSQYLSSRYFAVLTPLVYIVYAEGLWAAGQWLALPFKRAGLAHIAFVPLVAGTVSIHAGLYLPELYRAREKGYPHAGAARWLNENAVPGSPYFYDCGGWDMRYIPGYYPTPGLTPAIWIAWNGPDYGSTVKALQRQLMDQFPISYDLRHPDTPWEEADRFYRRKEEIRNRPMIKLRLYGIVTDVDTTNLNAEARDILYNTREDALDIALEAGRPEYADYPGFRCEQSRIIQGYTRPAGSRNSEFRAAMQGRTIFRGDPK